MNIQIDVESYYDQIADIDPLGLDDFMVDLPRINMSLDGGVSVGEALETAVSSAKEEHTADSIRALASLRDLDFLIGSLLSQGVQPQEVITDLDTTLLSLGEVAGTVPRGTVYTYSTANPKGKRQRSFTGTDEENVFVQSVREGSVSLDKGLLDVCTRRYAEPDTVASGLQELDNSMKVMFGSIMRVRQAVPAKFFTQGLRPFFEPIVVNGESYAGAGGAQLQFVAIDYILWGNGDKNEHYIRYFKDNLKYLMPHQRTALNHFFELNKSCVAEWIELAEPSSANLVRPFAVQVLKEMRRFRYPHRIVAKDNFALRPEGSVGSGQYSIGALDVLVDKTNELISRLEISNGE